MKRAGGTMLSFTRTSRAYRLLLLHPIRFIRRLLAEHASPRSLGAAAALGVLIGASPLIGVHTFLVYYLACRLRLNRVMALGTNQLCMPPFVPALCIEAGYYLRHGEFLTEISLRTLGREALQRFWEWLLGSLLVGPVLAAGVGGAVWIMAWMLKRRGVEDARGAIPLFPPATEEDERGCASAGEKGPRPSSRDAGDSGKKPSLAPSEKATPAGQPRAAGTASPAPAPIDGRHP